MPTLAPRRALGRAGVVEGYRHVCRGCGHLEAAMDQEQRRCPKDGRKLWVKPVVRPIRFQDLRHTTASLLIMSGANLPAVQRILRHSDPKIRTEIYAHLAPEYLRAEVDRLSFGKAVADALPRGSVTQLLPEARSGQKKAGTPVAKARKFRPRNWSGKRDSNPRPSAWEADALPTELFPRSCRQICLEPGPLVKEDRRAGGRRPLPARRAGGD